MKKKIFKRGMAGLLAVLTAFTTLIGMGTTAFAKSRYILDLLLSVVVNPICFRSTAWADMLTAGQLKLYMVGAFVFPDFFDDYIFQSKQFCSIIFVEHRVVSFLVR